ncbi:MAG: hypothetical protein PHQ19_10155, partial [Candidatus Krumholzibacteria bacterium]|nr:hypothetical protein [Candidatus Krumholzibacteria bacterium]
MKRLHLWMDEPVRSGDTVTVGVTIEDEPGGARRKLWYRLQARFADNLTESYNPFVVGTISTAMRESKDLVVHGEVSRKLLENLEEFQAAWSLWLPRRYTRIEIIADTESDDYTGKKPDSAIATFSGGVDSSFTVYRHRKGMCGRANKKITTGIIIHGFNIMLNREDIFIRAADKAEIMANSLDMDLIRMATNYRDLGDNFRFTVSSEIASCMLLFENSFSTGLIASSETYDNLTLPLGSNPITDRLLSSDRLELIHDGAAYSRSEKVEVILNWPEAMKYLRVCWQEENLELNCCRCEKCIRTILNFRALGEGLPECFQHDVTDKMIADLKGLNETSIGFFEQIIEQANRRSVTGS